MRRKEVGGERDRERGGWKTKRIKFDMNGSKIIEGLNGD